MKIRCTIFAICLAGVLSSCSNTRFLTGNQILYTGRKEVRIINSHKVSRTSSVKNYVKSMTVNKVNNSLFGIRVFPPVGLWVHNYVKVNGKRKLGKWFYNTFSSYPVLVSEVNPDLRSLKIENDLFDRGYFHTKAWAVVDTGKKNPHKAKVSYFVDLSPPYFYDRVSVDTINNPVDSLMNKEMFLKEIKPGDQFNLGKLQASREEMARSLQEKGYFYFIPGFIDLKADSTIGNNMLDLTAGISRELPESDLSVYRINDIQIKDYHGRDTVSATWDTTIYEGMKIISSKNPLKPDILGNAVFFRKGDIYSYSAYQNTSARLNNLGVFSYLNILYSKNKTDSLSHLLDVKMDLNMADNINLDFETDMSTKSSGYFGPLLSVTLSNKNAFRGAERLKLGLTGAFEWQWGTRSNNQLGNYSYEFGTTSGLSFPRIVIPFEKGRRSSKLFQRTNIDLDLSILNRTAFYKMFSARTTFNYQWSTNRNIQHSFSPVYINSVKLLATTHEFDSVVDANIYIRKSFEQQFIIGAEYDFKYNNTLTVKPNNFLFLGGVSSSGNLVDLFARINKPVSGRPYAFLKNNYSQYLKFTTDFRYYRNGYNKSLVFRIYAGVGFPYGNSKALPYIEQFFSGGAYSIRAFTARDLGPGSYHPENNNGYIDQSGDIKLESNLELRFDMTKILKGALFLETGNIWLVNEDVNRPGSKFDINTFYDQLAVGTGFGLRFDFTFFVIRADLGLPLRTPYKTDGRNWLPNAGEILSDRLLNLAIGYPF